MIGRTICHYEILEQVGEGGMGTVYKALDTKLKVHRALKFIHPHLVSDPDFKQRFIQEAQSASSLDHPNICSIHQVDETPSGRPFICMSYYEGATLSKRLKEAPLPEREVFRTGFAIAAGLLCAHQNGIVHRDIKPGNIMITEDGFIKILDFGLAKLMGMAGVTKTGVTLGTVRYMSPEQATGEETDHRLDIWSLGLLMYEMATGTFPFKGDFDPAIIYSIVSTPITPAHEINPEINETLSRVIAKCLEKDPACRYQSIAEVINALGEGSQEAGWGSSLGEIPLPISNGGFNSIPARRRIWRRGLLAAAVVAAVMSGLIWWILRPPSIYATDMRVVVMPLENKAHPSQDAVTAGLSEVVTGLLDAISHRHDSMWVVPYRLVLYSEIVGESQAKNTFGVNYLVTGGLQRYKGGQALVLSLRDAESLEQVRSLQLTYDPLATVLGDSLSGALARLVGMNWDTGQGLADLLPSSGSGTENYLAGLGALQAGDQAESSAALESLVQQHPDFGWGWCALGRADWQRYLASGADVDRDSAVARLERAVVEAPRMWWPWFHLGEVYRRLGKLDGALEAFGTADSLDSGNPLVGRGLSRIFRAEGRLAEGEAALMTAPARRPDYFEAHRVLAMFYYRTDDDQSALANLDKTLALAPDDLYSLNSKGAIFHRRGDFALAREQFERAFALAPKCEPCSNIGLMLYHEEKFEESASFYELALELCGEDDPTAWSNLAKALYWSEGRRQESIPKFRKALELTWKEWERSPGDPLILADLIDFTAMKGDRVEAQHLLAMADSLGSDDRDLLYAIGNAHELLGDREAALRYLGEALRHGVPLERIQSTRELSSLVEDPRFVRMTSAASGTGQSKADSVQ